MNSPLAGLSKFDFFGVFLLRFGAGALAAYHGGPLLFGGMEAFRDAGSGAAIVSLPPNLFVAAGAASAVIQLLGGICLILGIFTRGAALLLTIVAGFGLANVIATGDYFSLNAFALLQVTLVFFSLAFIGPGRLSIDRKGI